MGPGHVHISTYQRPLNVLVNHLKKRKRLSKKNLFPQNVSPPRITWSTFYQNHFDRLKARFIDQGSFLPRVGYNMDFVNAVAYNGPLLGVAPGQRDRNARVLAVVHAAVPCREELLVVGKTTAVPITILKVLCPGYGVAPFVAGKKGSAPAPLKEGERAEPLFMMVNDVEKGGQPSVDMWSYVSKGIILKPIVKSNQILNIIISFISQVSN